ncbi:MAG: hypothetical protein M3296_00580 [Actinomycetota bacterium]|nr:hypothetical protein [Actinomycetota bacterium]
MLLALVLLAALAAVVAARAAAGVEPGTPPPDDRVAIGVADQKADMFSDRRFALLGIRYARLNVGWDALNRRRQRARIDRWLGAAREQGVEPLISFGHSLTRRRSLPSPERMSWEFARFRARYPWVDTFATWNEANHCGEPTCHRERLVANYYRGLRRQCPECTILAAELLDLPNLTTWVANFRRSLGYVPRLWGLHNYIEANRFTTVRLRRLLRTIGRARLWLTETGGLVRRRNRSTTDIPEGARHAGEVTRYIFDRIVPAHPQIRRVYLYHWDVGSRSDRWDSALIAPGGTPRTSYYVLARVLERGSRPTADFLSPRR